MYYVAIIVLGAKVLSHGIVYYGILAYCHCFNTESWYYSLKLLTVTYLTQQCTARGIDTDVIWKSLTDFYLKKISRGLTEKEKAIAENTTTYWVSRVRMQLHGV